MVKALTLELNGEQRSELVEMRNHHPLPYLRERAAALLKIAAGLSGREVARHRLLRCRAEETIYAWVQRYREAGVAGLRIRPGRGRKPAFAPQCPTAQQAQATLLHVVGRPPEVFGIQRSRWTLGTLLETCRWLRLDTQAGLWQVLKRVKLHYKRARDYLHSPDADYTPKLEWIAACWHKVQADPTRYVLLYLDEFTFYRQPTPAAAYALAGSKTPLAQRSYRSDTTARVIAALNAATGQVTYLQRARTTLPVLRQFYYALHATYPTAEQLFVVQDNWPVHVHPDVLVILEKQLFPWPAHPPHNWTTQPRAAVPPDTLPIQMLFLPTYAPWTNPIEKLWRWLNQDVLHLHRLSDQWDDLKQRVCDFLDDFAQPSPTLLHYVGLLPD